jgi:hypothetical protein
MIGEFLSDMNLIIKLFALFSLASFVRNHVQNTLFSTIIILVLGYYIFFANWALFGGLYVLYMLFALGVGGVVVDYFFAAPAGQEMPGLQNTSLGDNSPDFSSVDLANRQKQVMQARQRAGLFKR